MKSIPQEFQQEFDYETQDLGLRRLLLAGYIGIICMLLFNILDFFVAPKLQFFFLQLRLINVAIISVVIILTKTYEQFLKHYLFAVSSFCVLTFSTSVTIMILFLDGHKSPYYAGLILVIIGSGIVFPWTIAQGGIVFGTIYGGYIGSILLLDKIADLPLFITNNFFLLPCIIYALISLYIHHNYRKKEFLSRIELTQAKDTIQEAFTKLKKVDEMKTDFVSSVSHDLRTPLTSVIGFASNTLKIFKNDVIPQLPETDDKLKRKSKIMNDNLSIIVSEGKRLTRLINDVLDIAKMEAGKVVWNIHELDLIDICKQSLSAVAGFPKSDQVEIDFKYIGNTRPVMADPDRLIQVIANLMSNALKFTEQGHVILNLEFLENHALVFVQDTGSGISKEDIPEVFSKFKQAGDTLTNKPKGTGLGLSICKEIIEHMGCSIWVESELEKGSCFYFKLNYCLDEDDKAIQVHLNKLDETERAQK